MPISVGKDCGDMSGRARVGGGGVSGEFAYKELVWVEIRNSIRLLSATLHDEIALHLFVMPIVSFAGILCAHPSLFISNQTYLQT